MGWLIPSRFVFKLNKCGVIWDSYKLAIRYTIFITTVQNCFLGIWRLNTSPLFPNDHGPFKLRDHLHGEHYGCISSHVIDHFWPQCSDPNTKWVNECGYNWFVLMIRQYWLKYCVDTELALSNYQIKCDWPLLCMIWTNQTGLIRINAVET